ncbi:MAG: guanine deaminase [Actinomycetota bacterium]|nr:guanine deaminase [Actinomycetota bacterium]
MLVRGVLIDTPDDPFRGGALRVEEDGALFVDAGVIRERGPWATIAPRHRDAEQLDLRGGLVLPGFVDTHVHFPQVRVVGGLGMPLLEWLERCALPEEARLADAAYAQGVARDFVSGLVQAGTTSALVFGSHFAPAVDALFDEAQRVGLRVTAGLVLADRVLRDDLLTTPERALAESRELAARWHGHGRLRYAVTPRFSLSASDELLGVCAQLAAEVPGAMVTSHLNENPDEIDQVGRAFPGAAHYLDSYDRHGLVGPRTVLAHDVHPRDAELTVLAARGAAVAHCPTSNAALGSGLFPLRRHLDAGVAVALGSDVGAGTGFSLLKEGLQALFHQQLLGPEGRPLRPAHLLHLVTRAGARALGLDETVGDLGVGRSFDAVWMRPTHGTTADVVMRHAPDAESALAAAFALGTSADTAGVWVAGRRLHTRSRPRCAPSGPVEPPS